MLTATRQARLSHQELGQLRSVTAVVMALVGFWTVTAIDLGHLIIIWPAIIIQLSMLVFPRWPVIIPYVFWKYLTPVLILFIISDFFLARPDLLPPLARMIALLALWRTIAPRQAREDQQLVLLCLIMVILTGVMTLSLLFAFQLLLFTPLAMGLLFLVNLQTCGGQGQLPLNKLWQNFRWGHFLIRLKSAVDYRLLTYGGLLFMALLAMTLGIFFTMPRFDLQRALPFLQLKSDQSLTGFSDEITYGDVVDIIEDNRIALRVDVSEEVELPSVPYWRMIALDEYTGRGFRMSASAKKQADTLNTHRFGRINEDSEEPAWTYYFEGGISRYLPLLGNVNNLRFQNRVKFDFNPLLWIFALEETPGKVFFYQNTGPLETGIVPRQLVDSELAETSASVDALDEDLRYPQTTLELPLDYLSHSRLRQVVNEILSSTENKSVVDFTEQAISWLTKNHSYSLKTKMPEGEGDALVRWMMSSAAGHCELYAGSLTLILRAAGYPARVVTGFKGGTWNGYENYFMVRNSKAHAWVEVYDPKLGWLRADPTPGSDDIAIAGGALTGLLAIDRTFGAYLDSLRVLWYRRIVNFDQRQQQAITDTVKKEALAWIEDLKKPFRNVWSTFIELWEGKWQLENWMQLLKTLLIITVVWLAFRIGIRYMLLWLSRQSGMVGEMASSPIRFKAGRWLNQLKDHSNINTTHSIQDVKHELLQLRYDRVENWPNSRQTFKNAARIKRSLRRSST